MTDRGKNKSVAVVLGGTSPHVRLIEKLKERGFYVCLIDYLKNPPGAAVADEHIQESTLDLEAVERIAREKKAGLVISTCIDQANSTCCYVAEKLDLPHPYSYQTSLDVTDKARMKRIFVENQIPTSWFQIMREDVEEDACADVPFPAVVKPVDCNSSKGVHRVDGPEEAYHYLKQAIQLSRTKAAIIEGFNAGAEIQVDCLATEDDADVIMTRQKQKASGENTMVLQSFGSIVPAPLTPELTAQARDIARKIAKAFQLKNTPFFYQAIVTNEGIQVLEFAPRIGGGLSYYLIKLVTGFDPIEAAIKSFLGEPVDDVKKPKDRCYSTNLLYMHPGTFDHIEGLEQLKADSLIQNWFVMKNKGDVIDDDMRSGNRVGAFVIEADSYQDLFRRAEIAYSRIEIKDNHGNKMLNRDMWRNRIDETPSV